MNEDGKPQLANYALFSRLRHEMTEAQTVTCACAHCDWTMVGPLCETREAFTAHRKHEHPLVRETLPNPRRKMLTGAEMRAAA